MTFDLFARHFQLGYVVRDVTAAIAAQRQRFGIAKWQVIDTRAPGAPANAIALAYAGDVMIELIEADPAVESIYSRHVPDGAADSRLHHLGFLVHDDAAWEAGIAQFANSGFTPAFAGAAGDALAFHYADSLGALGHYLELIHLKPAGKDFFAAVPRN